MGRWGCCYGLLFPLVAAAASPCAAQGVPSCPTPMGRSAGVARLCAEALPDNGKLLLTDKAGAYCTCECSSLLDRSFSEVLRDRDIRDASDQAQALTYLRSFERAIPGGSSDPVTIARIEASGSVTWYSSDTCAYELHAVEIVQRLFDLGCFKVSRSSCVTIESSYEIGPFPVISYAENGSGGSGTVTSIQLAIPERLLRDATVQEELLVFILLHEWGHAARNEDLEYSADEWATFIGLPKYYGWLPRMGCGMRDKVIAQLEDYYRSVLVAEDVPLASDTTVRDPDTYAELACRLNGIKGMYVASQDAAGMAFGYPADCWDDAVEGSYRLRTAPYAVKRCDDGYPLPAPRGIPGSERILKGAADGLIDALESLERLRDPCLIRPEFCGLTEQEVIDRLRLEIPGYAVREEDLVRMLSSAAGMLRSLRQDLERHR